LDQVTFPLVVPRNKFKQALGLMFLFALFFYSLIFSVAVVQHGFHPWTTRDGLMRNFVATVGPICFAYVIVVLTPHFFKKDPVLRIDDEGIYVGWNGIGLIPWPEVAGVTASKLGLGSFYVVQLRNLELTAQRMSAKQAKLIRHNVRMLGGVPVPDQALKGKVSSLVERTAPYVNSQIHKHGKPPIVVAVPTA
jgi:hypothetical protein